MALLLCIDTSSRNCSVCIADDNRVLASRIQMDSNSHAQILASFIDEVFEESGIKRKELEAIVVSAGPGSYTGLRIGMSTAKGMCYALDIPLIALDSLENLALEMYRQEPNEDAIYIATLDSRKGEIYYAVMDGKQNLVCPSTPAIVKDLDWDKWKNKCVYIGGNTFTKLLDGTFEITLKTISLTYRAENYLILGSKYFSNKSFDSLVYKEQNYLKPFQ
jgi:tRNA threonylcarbamoyladenosine biosynthesis protein TsaB